MLNNNYTPKSTYIDTHQYSLSELAQTCVTAAHLIDIAENELEQYLYEQAIEALKDEQASLCGGIE